jgi:chromosome segregation protein
VFLKSLEIYGFKSFADRTKIEFASGISALLGPNGCGKSNVVDAIKWVVGEQSARSLRAESMEDVIFNGTETRKQTNVAEVTVTLSNESGVLAVEMPEVSIKRRLYRSGESEYLINNQQVKLKDIRELFWDTGIGKSAYSVMEQGRIDQILSSKPEERRYLFEEAAGITRHKVRGKEAESKLERTEENMKQVAGVLAEVKRSHDTLKAQSEKTTRYRELKQAVFEAELDSYLLKLRGFLNEKSRRDEDAAAKTKERDAVKAEIDAINMSLEESLDAVNGLEARIVEHQKTLFGLAVERNGLEKQRKLISDRVGEGKAKLDQLSTRVKTTTERIEGLREDADAKEADVRALEGRIAEIARNIEGFEGSIRDAEGRQRDNDADIAKAESDIVEFERSQGEAQIRLDAITEDIVAELDARLKEIGYSIQGRKRLEEEIETALGGISVSLGGKAALVEDWARAGSDPAEAVKVLERLRDALSQVVGHADELRRLYADYKKLTPGFIDEFLSPQGIITKKRAIDAEMQGLKDAVVGRRNLISSKRDENKALATKVSEYRATLEEQRGNRIRMQAQAQAAGESLALIKREIAGQEGYLRELENELFAEEKRLEQAKEELEDLDSEIAGIEVKGRTLTAELESLERDVASRNSDLSRRQVDLKKKMERLAALQNDLERVHMSLAQNEIEIRNIKENFKDAYSRELMEFEERMFEIRKPAIDLRDELARLRNQLKELGSVNLMAPEEYGEVKERYDFLRTQMEDLEKARDDLKRITDEIREESAELFLTTYNKIKKNFHNIFRRLFGGGRGELRLIDPDHVLTSGIEIYAQPPGKKLENITLLSGGEKSMTAIGLLFATYMVRPSPFCFLDEIDAALDEANVIRFVNVLREFGRQSQFIVITHNKKTVTGADALLGVTMEESGVTKAIAVRLERPDAKPAAVYEPPLNFVEEDVEYEEGREVPPPEEKKARAKRERAEATAADGAQPPEADAEGVDATSGSDGSDAESGTPEDSAAIGGGSPERPLVDGASMEASDSFERDAAPRSDEPDSVPGVIGADTGQTSPDLGHDAAATRPEADSETTHDLGIASADDGIPGEA